MPNFSIYSRYATSRLRAHKRTNHPPPPPLRRKTIGPVAKKSSMPPEGSGSSGSSRGPGGLRISTMNINDLFPGPYEKGSIFVYDGKQWVVNPAIYDETDHRTLAVGTQAGKKGKTNVYIGFQAGQKTESNENTHIGYNSGTVQSGGLNTFVGQESGRYSSGTQNTYVGDSTCSYTGSDGSYNTFLGAESGFKNTSGNGNVFAGAVAGASNQEGNWNVFVGQSAGQANETGSGNIFVGANAGVSNVSGENCICIGDGADTSSEDAKHQLVFGHNTIGYGNHTITFPDNLITFPNGTEVNFSSTNGGCLYPVSSSRRWKQDIQPLHDSVDTSNLYKLEPVTYHTLAGRGDTKPTHVGLIAEEVDKYFPELVPKDKEGLPSSVRYSLLSVLLLAELKNLKKKVDEKNISEE